MATPVPLVNLRTHLSQAGDTTLSGGSLIVIEFFGCPTVSTKEEGAALKLSFTGAELNMPAGTYNIYDSLINRVRVEQDGDQVVLTVERDRTGPWELKQEEGTISRFSLSLDPAPLVPLFQDKVVLLDPLARPRAFSPTRLPEGVPTRDVARRLGRLLSAVGAKPHQSPGPGPFPVLTPRSVWSGGRCDLVLGIATTYNPQRPRSGFGLRYRSADPASLRFAQLLKAEMERKLPLPILAVSDTANRLLGELPVPGAVVEVGCLSHRVDEGLMRDIDYKQKVAQTLFNAIRNFFAGWKADQQM